MTWTFLLTWISSHPGWAFYFLVMGAASCYWVATAISIGWDMWQTRQRQREITRAWIELRKSRLRQLSPEARITPPQAAGWPHKRIS